MTEPSKTVIGWKALLVIGVGAFLIGMLPFFVGQIYFSPKSDFKVVRDRQIEVVQRLSRLEAHDEIQADRIQDLEVRVNRLETQLTLISVPGRLK